MTRLIAVTTLVLLLSSCGPGSFTVPSVPATGPGIPPGGVAPSDIGPVATSSSPPSQAPQPTGSPGPVTLREFAVPAGSGPHDVAPAADGGVWFTAQRSGKLGWLDPKTGQTKLIGLGLGSAPHGVIVGPDGAPWITDGGLNAIVRVDPKTSDVRVFKLPGQPLNVNTATFDRQGKLWWTGQDGWYGSLDVAAGDTKVLGYQAPRGPGPYGITTTPAGEVYYASLAASHIARIDVGTARAVAIDLPTKDQGARRVWSDSKGILWVSEWNAGQLARYDPKTGQWKEWKLPGARPQAYAVFVDDRDIVWLSEWSASAIVRFDPATERFDVFPHAPGGSIRQLHGRSGEVWGALSALDRLIVVVTR